MKKNKTRVSTKSLHFSTFSCATPPYFTLIKDIFLTLVHQEKQQGGWVFARKNGHNNDVYHQWYHSNGKMMSHPQTFPSM